jgi:hypothetical protein
MRVITLLSVAATALAFKFHHAVPKNKQGVPLSHQLPELNIALTSPGGTNVDIGVKMGKRRMLDEYVPSAEELDLLARQFEDDIPRMYSISVLLLF